jgi:hypothetical protein
MRFQRVATFPRGEKAKQLSMGCAGSKQVAVDDQTVATPGGTRVPQLDPPPTPKNAGGAVRAASGTAPAFTRAHADITLAEGGAEATMTGWDGGVAAGEAVMSEGKHFVQFTVLKGEYIYLGAMSAAWDVEGGQAVEQAEEGGCFFSTNGGKCYPSGEDWEGSQPATEEGDRVGMLLDLDEGSVTVYKNDERLGVMEPALPKGDYCWAVSLHTKHDSVRIEQKPVPE